MDKIDEREIHRIRPRADNLYLAVIGAQDMIRIAKQRDRHAVTTSHGLRLPHHRTGVRIDKNPHICLFPSFRMSIPRLLRRNYRIEKLLPDIMLAPCSDPLFFDYITFPNKLLIKIAADLRQDIW